MEYLLIIILQVIGVGLHVSQKVIKIGNENKQMTRNGIITVFWNEDWDSLFASFFILLLNLVAHYIVGEYAPANITEYEYYMIISFGLALLFGYAGQRIVYSYLGKAEEFLNKKVENKLG